MYMYATLALRSQNLRVPCKLGIFDPRVQRKPLRDSQVNDTVDGVLKLHELRVCLSCDLRVLPVLHAHRDLDHVCVAGIEKLQV